MRAGRRGRAEFQPEAAPEGQPDRLQVFRIAPVRVARTDSEQLPLPGKPSIAVLHFTNISADADQEFFVDGLMEDLITELSKVPALFVIAQHSSFAFKNKPADVRRVSGTIRGPNHLGG